MCQDMVRSTYYQQDAPFCIQGEDTRRQIPQQVLLLAERHGKNCESVRGEM